MDHGATAEKTKVVIWLVARTGLVKHSGFISNVLVCLPFQEVNGTAVHANLRENAKPPVCNKMLETINIFVSILQLVFQLFIL